MILNNLEMKQLLPSNLVERGETTEQLLYQEDGVKVAIWEMKPNTEIVLDSNLDTSFYHEAETGKKLKTIKVDGQNRLVNDTGKVLRVLVVKAI